MEVLLVVLLLAGYLGGRPSSAEMLNEKEVATGPELVQEVQAWLQPGSSSGGNVTLQLQGPLVNLSSASWDAPNGSLPVGDLRLQGPPGTTVLVDAAMKSELTPVWDSPGAELKLANLVFINLCSRVVSVNPELGLYTMTTSTSSLFPRSRVRSTQTRTNVTMYVTPADIRGMIYWQVISQMPFSNVKSSVQDTAFKYLTPPTANISSITPYSLSAVFMLLSPGNDIDFTYRSTTNPSDPLRLESLGGTLLEHRWCDGPNGTGPLVPPERYLRINGSLDPIWVANDAASFDIAMDSALTFVNDKAPTDLPPIVFLTGDASLPLAVTATTTLRNDLIIHGPFNHDPATVIPYPVLSLGGAIRQLVLANNATLYLLRLVLADLAVLPLGNSPLANSTALPLFAVFRSTMGATGTPNVVVNNITFVLGSADYLALYAGALRGPAWKSGAVNTRQIFSGITAFELSTFFPPTLSMIVLRTYTGFGISGNNVRFVPDMVLSANVVLPDSTDATVGASTSRNIALAVGLGIGLGVPALAGAIAATVLLLRFRARQRRKSDDSSQPEDVERGGKLVASGSSAPVASTKPASSRPGLSSAKDGALEAGPAAAVHMQSDQTSNSTEEGGPLQDPASRSGKTLVLTEMPATGGSGGNPTGSNESGNSNPMKAVQAKADLISRSDADKLTLISVLGRGAWGTVYKGTWRGLTVAVKTVLFSEREDGDSTLPHDRAIMEAAVCISVVHRNVVTTYHYDIKPVRVDGGDEGLYVQSPDEGLGTNDWKLFLVQEWCNSTLGQALRSSLLHKRGTKEALLDLVLELLLDCAQGIAYLHDKNIIHGDLKPENVMLKTDSSSPIGAVAKITDMGLSTTLGPHATHVSNYKSGTPYYVAPEVTQQGRTTKASDAYSMGVLMWETYSCTPPWIKVRGEYRSNPHFLVFPPNTPKPFLALVQGCLQADPKLRPVFRDIVVRLRAMLDAWKLGFDTLVVPDGYAPPAGQNGSAAAGSGVGGPSTPALPGAGLGHVTPRRAGGAGPGPGLGPAGLPAGPGPGDGNGSSAVLMGT